MNVDVISFKNIAGEELIFVTSLCGRYGVDILISDGKYHCHPVGCYEYMDREFDNRKEALDFAENWCSIV